MSASASASKTLVMQVFDWDRFSKNDPMGEVKLQLGYFDLSRSITEWRQLQAYSGKVNFTLSITSYLFNSPLTAFSSAPECQQFEVYILSAQAEVAVILGRGEGSGTSTSSRSSEDQISGVLRQELPVTEDHGSPVPGVEHRTRNL